MHLTIKIATTIFVVMVTIIQGSEAFGFRFAVYSDTQWHPHIHRTIAERDLMPLTETLEGLDLVLVPGDLVHVGADVSEYQTKFLGPSEALRALVTYIPALGNHEYQGLREGQTPHFFRIFNPPRSGSKKFPGHWHARDHQNARIITLNSNLGARTRFKHHPFMRDAEGEAEQEEWLYAQLRDFCQDRRLDFMFVQFHHPGLNEIWTEGNEVYSDRIARKVGELVGGCGKAGAVFTGHAHAYSRGQDRDHPVYWVTVGTAGGRLDHWGEYGNTDYREIIKTWPAFGYVIVTVTQDGFQIKRYDLGSDPESLRLPDETDVMTYRKQNQRPESPQLAQMGTNISASSYRDADADAFGASHWQCFDNSDRMIIDAYQPYTNIYRGVDTLATFNHRSLDIASHEEVVHCRARYRDRDLRWSRWSESLFVSR